MNIVRSVGAEVRGVLSGRYDWMQNPVPPGQFQLLRSQYEGSQLQVRKTLSTYYFWLNTTKPPFDDVRVRQAVNYAVDADELALIYGGQLAPNHQILPPAMPGYHRFDLYPYAMAKHRSDRIFRRPTAQARLPRPPEDRQLVQLLRRDRQSLHPEPRR